ncbi:MAG: type VI secretion system protein TssA [Chitinispirillaceae bacterium]
MVTDSETEATFTGDFIISEHLSSLTSPFDSDNPFGENITYDPDFELVKAEIGKPGNIDFELLEEKSLQLLQEKSKDIRLFSFLSLCYLKKEKWEQFCDVFEALGQLVKENYDSLFPARPRARQLALKWLSEERFTDAVDNAKPPPSAHEDIKRLVSGLLDMRRILEEKFPDGSPFPLKFCNAAQKWEKSTEPRKEPSPEEKKPSAAPQAASPAAASGSTAASTQEQTSQSPKEALETIRKSAVFLIEKEPAKPTGYRLIRSVRWGSVQAAPLSEGNTTRLEPPAAQRRSFLHSALDKGDFKTALETAEKMFSSGPTHFWLDLQRISYTAARSMGSDFEPVCEAIVVETALFIKRMPRVKELTYSDGTPFCDMATSEWLDSEVQSVFSSGEQSKTVSGEDPVEDEKREAVALAMSGKIENALEHMAMGMAQCGSERDNFRRRLAIASVLINAKRADISMYLLETLHEAIDRYNLHIWEPSLAVEALNLLARAYSLTAAAKQGPAGAKLIEKREEVMRKLSFVDPKTAYKHKM